MSTDLVKAAAQIVEAYVSNNEIPAKSIPGLLQQVHGSLSDMAGVNGNSEGGEESATQLVAKRVAKVEKKGKPQPAVPVDEAVKEESITCLMCGKICKALKGHLTRTHKINSDEYRKMFDLPRNFPMVAPAYAEKRRQLAIDSGLAEKLQKARKKTSRTKKV